MRMRLALVFALLSSAALAQSGVAVKQSGNITPNQVPWWISSGVIGGGVTSADSPISSFGVTNNGGNGLCANSDRITAAGRNTLCFGTTTNGHSKIIVQNYGTATAQPLDMIINGTTYPFPFVVGGIVGPNSTTVGDLVVWNNTAGTLVKDSNVLPNGATATTQALNDATTKVATDAFVQNQIAVAPLIVGTTSISGGTSNCIAYDLAGVLACSTTLPSGLTIPGFTGTGADTTYNFRANNLSDVANATTSIQNLFSGQYIGIPVNSQGAVNDGVTNNARYIAAAATLANTNKVGLIFSSGINYKTTPIQFGGSNPATGTFTGSISTTTLTVTSTPTIPLTVGQTLTGAGVTAGTKITALGTKTGGWIGTYTVDTSQTVGSITFTATAPTFTASIAGTTMTVTAVANGALNLVDSLVGGTIIAGTTIVGNSSVNAGACSPNCTGAGSTGTYAVSYSQTVTSGTVRAYPLTVVPIPNFVVGAVGGETQTIITPFGSNSVPTPLIKIVDPPALGAVLGFEIAYLRINAQSFNGNALEFHGFANTSSGGQPHAHDLTVTGATGSTCGMNVVGNAGSGAGFGVIESQFSRISAVGNTVCDYNFDGNNGDGSYNIQAVLMERISANSLATGDGFIQDYANTSCIECLSENMTGKALNLDHTHHSKWYDFYAESTAAITGTSNSLGVEITGQTVAGSAPNSTLKSCVSCNIDVYDGTNFIRNAGAVTASGQITSTFGTPTIASGACGTGTNGTIAGTNQSGAITIGASATTTCTVSFSATITAPNACLVFPGNATAAATGTTVAWVGAPSTSQWVLNGSALANTVYRYICL